MEAWSNVLLERVNDWSQIASLILLLLTLIAGLVMYATQKEITKRATAQEIKASADNQTLKASLEKTSKELESTKQELVRKTSDRSLTEEQKLSLKLALNGVTGKVLVIADFADSEAQIFANQINSVFAETDLDVIEQGYTGIVSLYTKGIHMLVKDIHNPPHHALPILKAFKVIGIEMRASTSKNAEFPKDALIVWVCHK